MRLDRPRRGDSNPTAVPSPARMMTNGPEFDARKQPMFAAPSTGDERPAGQSIADSRARESAVAWAERSTSKSPGIRVWSGAVWKLFRRRRFVVGCLLLFLLAACAVVIGPHLRAWYHFRAARRELDRYHNPQAIRHLQACLEQWPKDADAILLAARAARR